MLLAVVAGINVFYREQFAPVRFQLFVALALFALAAFTGIAGVVALGRNRTPFPAPVAGGELVSDGIFRVVRHPLYLSLILWAVSWALFWCSLVGFLFAGMVAVYLDLKGRREERFLEEKYPDYLEYARRVRRFVPGVY